MIDKQDLEARLEEAQDDLESGDYESEMRLIEEINNLKVKIGEYGAAQKEDEYLNGERRKPF